MHGDIAIYSIRRTARHQKTTASLYLYLRLSRVSPINFSPGEQTIPISGTGGKPITIEATRILNFTDPSKCHHGPAHGDCNRSKRYTTASPGSDSRVRYGPPYSQSKDPSFHKRRPPGTADEAAPQNLGQRIHRLHGITTSKE